MLQSIVLPGCTAVWENQTRNAEKKVESWARVLDKFRNLYTGVSDQERFDVRVTKNWLDNIHPSLTKDLCAMEQAYSKNVEDV